MAFIKKNFSFGTLASTLSAAATQLTMTAGHSLPTTTGEFRLVIWDAVTYPNPSDDSNVEIITGSFNAGNVYDIIRAEESTSDVEHAAGSKVGLHFTVGVYESDLALVAASFKTFFLSDTGSGVGSLNYAYPHETTEAESTIVSAGLSTGNDQLIKGYITEVGEPGTTTIHAGIFPAHLHAKKGASNHKTTQLYAVLSSVDADGTSNKITITTTNISDPLTDTEMAYELHMSLAADLEVADTARLILDVYANVGSGSQDSVVTLYMEANHDSYWSTAVDSGIWQTHSDKLDDLATTDATGAELTELTDSSETILHSHAGSVAPQEANFEVTKDDAQTLVAGVSTKIEYDDEVTDPDGVYDAVTEYEFVCPATGTYLFVAYITVTNPDIGDRLLMFIHKDDAQFRRIGQISVTLVDSTTVGGSALVKLTLNEVIDVRVFLDSASGNHSTVASAISNQFSGIRIF